MRATRAIIHLDNLAHNIGLIRSRIGKGPSILLPVKADAYGHGAVEVAAKALACGVSHLAVASVEEGVQLRRAGIASPVLLLSLALPEEYPSMAAAGIEPLVGDIATVEAVEAAIGGSGIRDRPLSVHIKLDTGMGRIGCRPADAPALARRIASGKGIALGGLFTHFPVSDEAGEADRAFTIAQIETFVRAAEALRSAGTAPAFLSAANSGAIISFPEASFDLVRPGILCYGYHPNPGIAPLALKPVMSLVSRVIFIKSVKAGESVSYGRAWTADRATTVATLPLGYADGYPRSLSNRGKVLIGGRVYPVIGRVCMDQLMVDLGPDSGVGLHDEAILFGPEALAQGADDLAAACGTIPYEITCNVNKRVPRVFLDA